MWTPHGAWPASGAWLIDGGDADNEIRTARPPGLLIGLADLSLILAGIVSGIWLALAYPAPQTPTDRSTVVHRRPRSRIGAA